MPKTLFVAFSGAFARNIRRLLADGLGAAFADDCHDDEVGRTKPGEFEALLQLRHLYSVDLKRDFDDVW